MRSEIPLNILTSDVLVPVYGTYENLVVSSVGLKRFNLLGSSASSRTDMSSLGCVVSFSRYLVLKLVICASTFWRRNFFLNFSTPCISNVNNTGTKYVIIMKQTAF